MNSKYIILREGYDWLNIGEGKNEISISEYKNLCVYLKNNIPKKVINYDYNKIKFINYVGIIKVDKLIIEILPKISLSNDKINDRKMLIFMLSKCNKIPVNIAEIIDSNIINNTLLNIIGKIYCTRLLKELQKGVYREYVPEEDILTMIKGKVIISKSIKENTINRNKLYCSYDEFTENNMFNSILKRAVNILLKSTSDGELKKDLNIINNILIDVQDVYVQSNTISNYKLNRMNSRFLECFSLAKLILLNSSMDKSRGKENGFSILFEMNYLYEEYIAVLLKEICSDTNIDVNAQEKSKYLLWNTLKKKNEIMLKPDVVLYKDNKPKIIIDTKWKSATIDGKEVYTQGDIYQMYAYITTYEECQQCILLYPKTNENIKHSEWVLNDDIRNKKILIYEINLENHQKTKNELLYLINK